MLLCLFGLRRHRKLHALRVVVDVTRLRRNAGSRCDRSGGGNSIGETEIRFNVLEVEIDRRLKSLEGSGIDSGRVDVNRHHVHCLQGFGVLGYRGQTAGLRLRDNVPQAPEQILPG